MAERIPAWFGSAVTRYLAPEIIRIVDERVSKAETSLRELMNARFKAVEDTMNARFETLNARIDGLEKRLDLVQRVALLEAKVKELEGAGRS